MQPSRVPAIAFLGTLLLSLVALTPSVAAVAYTEGWESFMVGETDPETDDFTFSATGASTFVSSAQAHTGSRSLKYEGTTSTNGASMTTNSDICQPGSAQVWLYMESYSDAGDSVRLIWGKVPATLSTDPVNEYIQTTVNDAGVVSFIVEGAGNDPDSGIVPATFPLSTWVDFNWQVNCTTGAAGVFSSVLDSGISVDSSGISSALDVFTIRESTPDGGHSFYIDDVAWDDGVAGPVAGSHAFCADPNEEDNFGYDYVEDVTFGTGGPTISLDDAFLFNGDNDDSEYLAKGFTTGSTAIMVRARLETDAEGATSLFRIAFTTGATALTAGAAQDSSPAGADFLASSDGQDGGNFDNHVQVLLKEDGSNWYIRAYTNVAGAGLTQIPGAVTYQSNPNNPTTFQVVVNSGTGLNFSAFPDGPNTVGGHYLSDQGDQVISLQDGDGGIIWGWNLPAGLHDAVWKDQWFIGKGDSGLDVDAFTYLDDTDQTQDDDSTCIWDLTGTLVVTGSEGLVPGSSVPPPPGEDAGECVAAFCPPPEGVGNLSSTALSLFLGIVIVAAFAASMSEKTGSGAAGIAIFALLGLFLAYALGYIQLWVIVALTTIGVGGIFLGIKNGSKGTGM